ncbi:SH2 domain-containing adapter protein F-like isoform X2 [Oncorhynchus tshawytscha]|uniref:SH2 domain-containing protein n=1 Tax=Oncorhynchus mykiss TaxID=8022 RepID=A0A8C7SZV0_ONCMY|nr:SH2 domain-containing adapter protein F-like isoform X2 [Oncorhynchus tshawytscha]XP_031666212.1 SH2 domain-containing adapter protein F isoform X2 [Oncorhynchus kisutch]XP_035642777.2 SH2 domain-containing adapter protein F-like isoform X2 [Oncorhynchus keta]XP_036836586.1 SH2 domain-containing adapter protein F isoform X1 [Oncorhynchus mykiss]
MARWFREHLGFKTTKAPPPAPPKPDYRYCHAAVTGTLGYQQPSSGATSLYPSPAQPDILAAYKLQKELDFEDPYTGGGNISFGTGLGSGGSPDIKYVSPKHRLIKVETIEKSNSAPGSGIIAQAVAVGNVKSPTSPPPENENKEKLIILDDYADPFDAEQDGGTQATTEKVTQASTENDGYMEPYEAQKMMAEIRGGRGPKEGSLRSLPLYDTPYEPAENGGDSDGERPRCPRESRLPQDDERPPEEYDQPWEWKKERISKAFAALLCSDCISYKGSVSGSGSEPETRMDNTSKSLTVQFEGAEKSRMSPTREGKGGRPPRIHSSCCLVNTKMSSLDHCSAALGERIDPSMSLESQFWYHGAISRTDAESLLRLCKEASYLVRNSETSKNDFSLSLKSSQGFMHMKLSRTKENKYILGQNSCPFDSVPEIIHFYSSRKLPIKGAEHMSLLYPVAIRTL